jgi:MFS family permease
VLGTTVGVGTALGPLVGGALIALGGQRQGWRLVFFVNIPIGIVVILLARLLLPADRALGRHRLDALGAALLGGATFCVLFAAVQSDALHDRRLAWLGVPALVLLTRSPGASACSPGYGRTHSSTYACSGRPPTPPAYCSR